MHSNPAVEYRVVHDRDLVLALDWLYRDRMIDLERTRLLDCARSVARALGIAEAPVPVEGYYAELPELTEYFRLMRALRAVVAVSLVDAARGSIIDGGRPLDAGLLIELGQQRFQRLDRRARIRNLEDIFGVTGGSMYTADHGGLVPA